METTESRPPRPASVTDYPKIYRQSVIKRFFLAAISFITFLPSVAFVITPESHELRGFQFIFVWASMVLFSISGILMISFCLTSKVTLYADRVEQTGMFGTKAIRRQEIEGYRASAFKGATFVDLIPINDQLKAISVPRVFTQDAVFAAWLKDFRNLNRQFT